MALTPVTIAAMTDTPAPLVTDPPTRWVVMTPLADLVPADWNPKEHAEAVLDGSLDDHGYVEPISLDGRTGRLIAGHGRMEALQRRQDAGEAPPEGVALADDGVTWLVPIVHGWSSQDDEQARDYLVLANRSVEAGGWKRRSLAEYLAELDARAGAARSALWGDDDYRDMLVETGVAADRGTDFLNGVEPGDGPAQGAASGTRQTTDIVDLRLPMPDRERDEAIALLRQHQRTLTEAGRPAATLSDTALEVLRTWQA